MVVGGCWWLLVCVVGGCWCGVLVVVCVLFVCALFVDGGTWSRTQRAAAHEVELSALSVCTGTTGTTATTTRPRRVLLLLRVSSFGLIVSCEACRYSVSSDVFYCRCLQVWLALLQLL